MLIYATSIVRDYELRLVDPTVEWKWAAYFTLIPHQWPIYVRRRETLN